LLCQSVVVKVMLSIPREAAGREERERGGALMPSGETPMLCCCQFDSQSALRDRDQSQMDQHHYPTTV